MRDIHSKPLADFIWSDIELIASSSIEEDQRLEFKRCLPTRDGNPDRWQQGAKKIGDYARDALAKEIVAFANAYGGLLIVGIDEADERPARSNGIGELIRACQEIAEPLEQAIRSRLDPPLTSLEVRAISSPNDKGNGVIIVRVGPSNQSPHGVGRPPECYVRRGASSEPLGMRELQNMFWEARTARERIQDAFKEQSDFLSKLIHDKEYRKARTLHEQKFIDPSMPYLAFRCTAVISPELPLTGIALRLLEKPLGLPKIKFCGPRWAASAFRDVLSYGWQPRAHKAIAQVDPYATWSVTDQGVVDVCGLTLGGPDPGAYCPELYSVTVAQIMVMADRLRHDELSPDRTILIDCEFRAPDGQIARGVSSIDNSIIPEGTSRIGPFEFLRRDEMISIHRAIEQELFFALGMARLNRLDIDFEGSIKSYASA
jgi:hypothetical protein